MNSVEPPPMSIDEPRRDRARQLVRDAEVDEPRLLMPADHVDGKAERALGDREELARVLRDSESVGRDCAHRGRMQPRQTLPKTGEALEGGSLRGGADPALCVETRAEAQRLAPGVEAVDLIALDAADLQPEAVRSQIDDGERGGGHEEAERVLFCAGEG